MLPVVLLLVVTRASTVRAETTHHFWTVSGVVTAATPSRLVIQTPTGGVTAALEGWSRVVRAMNGSGADIHAGAHLWAHLQPGTTIVNQVAVCSPGAWIPPHASTRRIARPHVDEPPAVAPDPNQAPAAAAMFALDLSSGENNWLFGSVTRVGSSSLLLDVTQGKSISLTEAPNMLIAKYTWGNAGDLAPGEEVQATLTRQGFVHSVTIVNA
jgi:hypothetical protein